MTNVTSTLLINCPGVTDIRAVNVRMSSLMLMLEDCLRFATCQNVILIYMFKKGFTDNCFPKIVFGALNYLATFISI